MSEPEQFVTGSLHYSGEVLITPSECVKHGGHCRTRTGMARASSPPQYQEQCKHCGHIRWAIPREAFEYREDKL